MRDSKYPGLDNIYIMYIARTRYSSLERLCVYVSRWGGGGGGRRLCVYVSLWGGGG